LRAKPSSRISGLLLLAAHSASADTRLWITVTVNAR
jgi:hypothetical protein